MRIGVSNLVSESAANAPSKVRTGSAAAFMGLLSEFGGGETGPVGASSLAHREMSDPLGLASAEALTTASQAVPVPAELAPRPAAPRSNSADTPAGAGRSLVEGGGKPGALRAAVSARAEPGSELIGQGQATNDDPSDSRGSASRNQSAEPSSVHGAVSDSAGRAQAAGRSVESPGGRVEGVGASSGAARVGATVGKGAAVFPTNSASAGSQGAKPAGGESILRQERAEIAPQVANGLASLLLRKGGSMQIQLRPEALGRVRVDLTIEEGVVSARLDAESAQARQLLHSELDRLRSMLEHRGLRVERLEIASGEPELEARSDRDAGRGGWRMPAQDEPQGGGMEAAGDRGSSGTGDQERAWAGGPHGRAERRRPEGQASAAEAGAVPMDGLIDPYVRRSPVGVLVRLDTVA